jgi:2-methylcitrate dehydratase PrpD
VPTLLVHPQPVTVAQARFSLQHCLAAVLVDGKLSLEHFTPDALARADLKELGSRIQMAVHPDLVGYEGELAFAEVEVVTRDGSQYVRRADHPRGSRLRPLSQQEVDQKFLDCALLYNGQHEWAPAVRALRDLCSGGSVAKVVEALTVVGG